MKISNQLPLLIEKQVNFTLSQNGSGPFYFNKFKPIFSPILLDQECYLKVRTTLSTKHQVTTNSLDIDFTTHIENLGTVNATSNIEHLSSNIEEGDVNSM